MASKEYFIWCDESIKKGDFYSNFYGGVLVKSKDLNFVLKTLKNVVNEIGITEEIKWGKVDAVKLPAFIKLIDVFFDLVKANKIKVRIMFKQNAKVAKNLKEEHIENEYFLLYYQFIKHAFGLKYSNNPKTVQLRTHFDYLPDTTLKVQQFKDYITKVSELKSALIIYFACLARRAYFFFEKKVTKKTLFLQ